MDDELRRLERLAATGDYDHRRQWKAVLIRAGYPDPDLEDLYAPLTEFEEVQAAYDDIAWHARKALRWGWDWDARGGLVKAHHTWGHRGWNNRNSKRKTLRTHRDGSRRSNFKLKEPRKAPQEETPVSQRRKKRFGGREHRYGRDWIQNQRTGRYRIVYKFGYPDLDE